MKKYIIFIIGDLRTKPAQVIQQVAKQQFRLRPYQSGDYLTIDIKEHYETKRGKLHQLTKESVLCKVSKVWKNVVYVNIVGE